MSAEFHDSWQLVARLVNRVSCTHPECAELRRVRQLALTANRFDLVNTAERELGRCKGAQS